MNINHPILMEIYDTLLFRNKKKLVNTYNKPYLHAILKEDTIELQNTWTNNGCPILVNHMHFSETHIINLMNTYDLLCQPNKKGLYDNNALMLACIRKSERVALAIIQTYKYDCAPQEVDNSGN